MIKRIYVRTRSLKEGMKIDQAIVDRRGRILIARGAVLDGYLIDSLLELRASISVKGKKIQRKKKYLRWRSL